MRHIILDIKHFMCGIDRDFDNGDHANYLYAGVVTYMVHGNTRELGYDDACLDCVQRIICRLKDYKAQKEKEQ
jgi:hypothetical protein